MEWVGYKCPSKFCSSAASITEKGDKYVILHCDLRHSSKITFEELEKLEKLETKFCWPNGK
jgi:hypothetical protein